MTQTLSAALWLFLIMDKRQSLIQIGALVLLLAAAVVLNLPLESSATSEAAMKTAESLGDYQMGVALVIGASMLSGISAALTQRALTTGRHALFFSAELAVYGILFLVAHLATTPESTALLQQGINKGWNMKTVIPVVTNAFGGVVVGLVTKYAGGVVKGFALIAGIIITGFAQWLLDGKKLEINTWIAVVLVSASIYLHSSYPYRKLVNSKLDGKKEL